MHNRIMLSFYGLIFAMAAFATHANAVSLGKIDIASHLGEPFYAEVPITLDEGEVISSLSVELAAPADYRILEVYHDQALNAVRADVESDSRGSRIELTSGTVIDAPFFNLILKVRYGRATHYKKYPVFLDLPRAAQPLKKAAPLPSVSVDDLKEEPIVSAVSTVDGTQIEDAQEEEKAVDQPGSFDGWARTAHYGPMVYGDTVSTVADRLRIDGRYTRNQVMVALFEKNKGKFEQDNINLIQAGTGLDVPLADEVERINPDQARTIMKDHNQRWKELVKQPRYAAVAEAQRTRYSKRVRVGKSATGVAAAPISAPQEQSDKAIKEPVSVAESTAPTDGAADGMAASQSDAESLLLTESVAKLQKENEELQAKLAESDAKLAKLSASGPAADTAAVSEARIKKLELQLARLQAELDSARQSSVDASGVDWLMLIGGGLVLLLLGGGGGYLMRRERQHPAMQQEGSAAMPDSLEGVPDAPVTPSVPEEIDVEAVEEFSPDATEQMNTVDFEDAFTDSIPDLTDEETGEMQPFTEDMEEDPDPNVDYLSEADVYMRYGMEDEAEKQVGMALKLKDTNKDAHVKLVQIRKSRGDESGADEAISTARMVLSGELLSTFESTVSSLTTGGSTATKASLEDTLPPGALDVSDAEESLDDITLSGQVDVDLSGEEGGVSKTDTSTKAENIDTLEMDDIELPIEEVSEETAEEVMGEEADVADDSETEAQSSASDDADGLDFDLSGLDLPDSDDDSPELKAADETILVESGEEVEVAVEAPSDEAAETMDIDDLDLSDIELPGETDVGAGELGEGKDDGLMTADLDKTVVMDWSRDTVTTDEHDVGGESGAGELEIAFDDEDSSAEEKAAVEADVEDKSEEAASDESVSEESEPEIDEPESNLSSVQFDLDDLDVDLDEQISSDDLDDFSSTIQTSIDEIGEVAASGVVDEQDTVDLDEDDTGVSFGLESLDEGVESDMDEDATAAEDSKGDSENTDVDNAALEDLIEKSDDKDFDATLELDTLLSELDSLDKDENASGDNENSKKDDS